jgi:hypothetical protein
MYAWNMEVGADFDVDIAVRRVFNAIDDLMVELSLYPLSRIWIPVGNDFIHYDSVKHTTTFGDHFLDTDTRYAKVYQAAVMCMSYLIERCLEQCDDVEVFYVPGNHDTTTSYCLTSTLDQRYRLDDRVKVDLSMSPRKYKTYGGVILGFDHGKDCKPGQYPVIFGEEAKEHWSACTYKEVQIGHRHQRWERNYDGITPTNGILLRMNPSLCNVDSWHHRKGLIGEPVKSVECWRYDKIGYRGSHVAWARDDKNKNVRSYQE